MRLAVRFPFERRHSELAVSEAVDGIDAIEKAREANPDLILLDLAMPRLNDAEAASVLKNTLPETPIILFTMYSDLHADSLSAFIGVDFILQGGRHPEVAGMCRCTVAAKSEPSANPSLVCGGARVSSDIAR